MDNIRVCIVGMGYVGLPLAINLSKHFPVSGFDINQKKIDALKQGIDPMGEMTASELKNSKIIYTTDPKSITESNFVIVAIPTPITKAKTPDLTLVIKASETVGKYISKGSIVVYESTVYPGVTEDICIPIIEKNSGLKCVIDWKIGYSPERVNPGDKEHTIDRITKIVSGIDAESLEIIAKVYGSFTKIYRAENIKVAEAAKVIENIQRDLNIALMNELSLIFNKMNIDLKEVLNAAGTKWNFHKYTPGLVGGHCIGVDPYYLTHKAQELGYTPQIILAGRAINDSMGEHVAELTVKGLNKIGKPIKGSKVLILGLTFKENVRDHRNSKTKDIIEELRNYGVDIIAHDPYLTQEEIDEEEFGVKNISLSEVGKVDGIILTVPHKEFANMTFKDYDKFFNGEKLFVDVKGYYDKNEALKNKYNYIRL
jgi:UDP-N-acetyl-D-galactosamine dehydrogenase